MYFKVTGKMIYLLSMIFSLLSLATRLFFYVFKSFDLKKKSKQTIMNAHKLSQL